MRDWECADQWETLQEFSAEVDVGVICEFENFEECFQVGSLRTCFAMHIGDVLVEGLEKGFVCGAECGCDGLYLMESGLPKFGHVFGAEFLKEVHELVRGGCRPGHARGRGAVQSFFDKIALSAKSVP
jgi:hypothetical protein